MYVRVYNRGKKEYTGGKYLHVYWGLSSTAMGDEVWKGRELYTDSKNRSYLTGGHIETCYIKAIPPGGYLDIEIPWGFPQMVRENPDEQFNFCIMARIMDQSADDGYNAANKCFEPGRYNDQAQKNMIIVPKKDLSKSIAVFVRNATHQTQKYSFELVPRTAADEQLYSMAKVEFAMSPKIYSAWGRGGYQSNDLDNTMIVLNNEGLRYARFKSPKSRLSNVILEPSEFDMVKLRFDFSKATVSPLTFTYDLIQRDEAGNIVGGETFTVEAPCALHPIEIGTTTLDDAQTELSIDESGMQSVKWMNEDEEVLGNSESVVVTPRINNDKFSVVALNEEGDLATGSISLESTYGIKSVSANDGSRQIEIELMTEACDNSKILLASAMGSSSVITEPVEKGCRNISIDSTSLKSGIYVVSLLIGEQIIDQKKIEIQ